jgi:hypothetical protein
MPSPIMKYNDILEKILKIQILDNINEVIENMKYLIKKLPEEIINCLSYLFNHFKKLTQFSKFNHMNIRNLSIVFGPCLFKCIQSGYGTQNQCVERFITYFDQIFI